MASLQKKLIGSLKKYGGSTIRSLLKRDQQLLYARDEKGNGIAHYAARYHDISTLDLLCALVRKSINKGESDLLAQRKFVIFHQGNNTKYTPLHAAGFHCNLTAVKFLVVNGGKNFLGYKDEDGKTVAHYVALNSESDSKIKILDFLVSHYPHFLIDEDSQGKTFIDYCPRNVMYQKRILEWLDANEDYIPLIKTDFLNFPLVYSRRKIKKFQELFSRYESDLLFRLLEKANGLLRLVLIVLLRN